MSVIKNYVCSAQAGCNKNFTKYTDLKRHEAAHSDAFHCRFAGCDFVTLSKASFEIHSDRHTGKQRYSCPHDCDFKTHNPAALTRHRKSEHGHVPRPRRVCARGRTKSASAIDANPLRPFQAQPQPPQPQPQVWLQPQPQPLPQPQFQFQFQPQPQPLPQPQFQFQLQPQPQPYLQFQPQPPAPHAPQQPYQNNHNHMLGVFNDRPDIVQYYTAPVGAANGWQAPAAFPPHQYHNNPLPGVFHDPGPAYPANGYAMYAVPAANGWPAGHSYRPQ